MLCVTVKVELLVLCGLSHYLLLPWSGGLTDTQQDWQQRAATLTLLLQRNLHDFVMLSHHLVRHDDHHQMQTPTSSLLHNGR